MKKQAIILLLQSIMNRYQPYVASVQSGITCGLSWRVPETGAGIQEIN